MSVTPLAVPDPATTKWVPVGPGPPGVVGAPYARVYRSTSQSIPSLVWTAVSFDTARSDTTGMWSAANPTRLTCKIAGTYIVTGMFQFAAAAGGTVRLSAISVNGAGPGASFVIGGQQGVTWNAGAGPMADTATVLQLNVGDYVEALLVQDSGAALGTQASSASLSYGTELSMALVGGPKGDTGVGVPTPVVNGQWVKGAGGAAVWSAIGYGDVANGIQAMSGNQFRVNWNGALPGLEVWIDGTKVTTLPNVGTSFTGQFVGPWYTAAPPPTGGQPFTIKRAGNYTVGVSLSAYAGAVGPMTMNLFIDGTQTQSAVMFANSAAFHLTFPLVMIPATFSVGTHYIAPQHGTNATSDSSDRASFFVLPTD